MKDKLFIFLTATLLLLFAASILGNIFFSTKFIPSEIKALKEYKDPSSDILTRLEKAGLEPREASYYQVKDE